MTKDHLTQLWKWISLGCFAYVVGSVITIQGGVDIFGAKLFVKADKDGAPAIGYFAAIIGGTLLSTACATAILHARRHGAYWHDRLPVLMLQGLDTKAREGKLFQAVVFVVLVVIPLYGIGRSFVVANEGPICEQAPVGQEPRWYRAGEWRLVMLPEHKNQLRLMPRDKISGDCGGVGVEIDWYTPVLFVGAPLLAATLVLWLLVLLFGARVADKTE